MIEYIMLIGLKGKNSKKKHFVINAGESNLVTLVKTLQS